MAKHEIRRPVQDVGAQPAVREPVSNVVPLESEFPEPEAMWGKPTEEDLRTLARLGRDPNE